MADACLSLDSVQFLTTGERRTFADTLRGWLESEARLEVQATSVVDKFGDAGQTVTAVVQSARGELVLQAAAGRRLPDLRPNMEHSYWVFSGLSPVTYPEANRLVIMESISRKRSAQDRLRRLVKRVAEVSYVGSYERQISLNRFLQDPQAPPTRDLAFETYGQIPFDPTS